MLDFESLSAGAPVPTVEPSDVKRVWEFTSEMPGRLGQAPGAVGWDIDLIAGQCSEGADPIAVFFRTALLRPLLDDGSLEGWREGERIHEVVFRMLATFPMPDGIQGFRLEGFVEALRTMQKSPEDL